MNMSDLNLSCPLSPETEKKILELKEKKLELEERKNDQTWSCCTKRSTDARLLEFIVKVGFGCSIIFFCMAQLLDKDLSCESSAVYIGLLSSTLGVFLPAPSLK